MYKRLPAMPYLLAASCLLAAAPVSLAQDRHEADSRTVLGDRNPDLAEGARRLIDGETEEGIRLTRLGLDAATSNRERQAGWSNLCAGYLRLEQPEIALGYCNQALALNVRHWRALCNRALVYLDLGLPAEADVDLTLAESIAPGARSVQIARGMWRDLTDPVTPSVVIDDRREPEYERKTTERSEQGDAPDSRP